jgi:putative MATE family efflux protein
VSHPLLTAPIGRSLFRLAGPTTALMLVQILVSIAEIYLVGRLGTEALAAIALVVPFLTLMLNVANGAMGGGVASSMARAIGAGRIDDARAIVVHALVLAVALGVFFTVSEWLFARKLFGLLGGEGDALEQALGFSHIWFAGAILMWASCFLAALLRGGGDTATPSLYGFVLAIAYVALAAALMLGVAGWPSLGLAGSAVAALATTTVSVVALARAIWSGRLGFVPSLAGVRLRWTIFRDILRVGGMGTISSLSANVTAMLVTGLVGRFGTAALAGYGIGARLEFMVAPIAFGIGSGLIPLVGVAAGAGAWPRAMRATWIGAVTASLVIGAIGGAVALMPQTWSRLFSSDSAVIAASVSYLTYVAPFYCLFGLGLTLYFASQGAGRMAIPVITGLTRTTVAIVGGWLFVEYTNLGLDGVFIAVAISMVVYGGGLSGALLIAPWRVRAIASGSAP